MGYWNAATIHFAQRAPYIPFADKPVIQGDSVPVQRPAKQPRLLSLDALRGLTILLMLLVNNVALDDRTPPQLIHAAWNGGVHLADLVFPWFLLCMGLSVPFSVEGMIARGMSGMRRFGRVLVRSAVLFLFGCVIVSAEQGAVTFSLDVLQLLALAYLFASVLYPLRWQMRVLIAAVLLAGYGIALSMIPLPPHGQPAFEESHNLITHVNQNYLARFNMAGLLSVVPTTALVLIGSVFTNALRSAGRSQTWKLVALAAAGIALVIASYGWNEVLPFNKTVWTPSYILLSAGLGAVLLAGLYWLMDLRRWTAWAYPLVVFGSNALAAYVFPVLIKVLVLQRVKIPYGETRYTIRDAWFHTFVDWMGRYAGGWAYTWSYILAVWLVLWVLYRKKWFLRV